MPVTRTTLRAATPHDANHIARLHTLSWQTAYSHILPASYLSDEVPTEHAVRWRKYFDRNENEWGLVLIAESNGEPVGSAPNAPSTRRLACCSTACTSILRITAAARASA
nr:hypothetical protein [Burkholderia cenocepacia]